MRDATFQSRQLQLTLKIVAIVCGCILLLASAHSNSASLDHNTFLTFIASQVQSASQQQWLCGIIFLSAGIFFVPIVVSKQRNFAGDKELSNDS